jgi:hypothetical protein
MPARWILAAAPLLLTACTDPPPHLTCAAPDCRVQACGYTFCGVACGAGSGCLDTRAVAGRLTAGGGPSSVGGGHSLSGCVEPSGGGEAASSGGHAIGHGSLTP